MEEKIRKSGRKESDTMVDCVKRCAIYPIEICQSVQHTTRYPTPFSVIISTVLSSFK